MEQKDDGTCTVILRYMDGRTEYINSFQRRLEPGVFSFGLYLDDTKNSYWLIPYQTLEKVVVLPGHNERPKNNV